MKHPGKMLVSSNETVADLLYLNIGYLVGGILLCSVAKSLKEAIQS